MRNELSTKARRFGAYPRRADADGASNESTLPWGRLCQSIIHGAVLPAARTRISYLVKALKHFHGANGVVA
jgi:hypothetical protein